MKTHGLLATLAVASTIASVLPPTSARAQVFESLRCIPDLPYARIEQEFSALLEKPECADVQIRSNIETHLLFVRDCRPQRSEWAPSQCKSFNFQINNATTDSPRATGALFYMKGSAKWCKPDAASRTWTAAEPEKILEAKIIKGSPQPSPDACPDQTSYRLASNRPASTVVTTSPAPPPSPAPAATGPTVPPSAPRTPPVPKCARDYRLVCSDLAVLRYLPSATATDAQFDEAVQSFLADEREPTAAQTQPSPSELLRLSAAAVSRPVVVRGCFADKSADAAVVACGRIF